MKDNYNGNRFYIAHTNLEYFNENNLSGKPEYIQVEVVAERRYAYNIQKWLWNKHIDDVQ